MRAVFNFWEPLHYLDQGHGFQTWETSPTYALRSWAYVLLHLFPAKFPIWLASFDKVSTLVFVNSSSKHMVPATYILCATHGFRICHLVLRG
jgi:hypothetical protein